MDRIKYWNLAGILFIISSLMMGYLVYSNFNKGLVMNDEAFYLFHFKDSKNVLTVDSTNYFRIFKVFYTDNIYHFRIITFLLLNSSSFLLFYSISKYYKLKIHPILFGFLGTAINFLTWQGTIVILNQYHGNTILTNLALSMIVFFLIYHKKWLLICSGFFMGILLFNGIPHSITVIPIILFLLINFWKKNKPVIYLFFTGITAGILFYFTFIEDLSVFIKQFEYIKIYKEFHPKQHPKRFYIIWLAQVVGFIFIPLSLTIFFLRKKKVQKENIDKLLLYAGIAVVIISSFYFNLFLLYVYTGLLLYRFYIAENISLEKKTLCIALVLLPFGLAFGSGFYFYIRGAMYQIYYFLVINIVVISIYNFRAYLIYLAFFTYTVVVYPLFLYDKGWKDFVYLEQTSKVKINGHDLYLDKERKKDIDDLRPYLQNQPNVIYSSNHLVGYLYILDARPPIYYYFALKDYVRFIIKKVGKTPDDFIYLESNDYPFLEREIVPLKFVDHPEKYKVVKAGRFTLYLPSNFQKK
ncbi:hypothetical protein JET18_14155 [Chryseobacterium sp. L7]|uniref:Glycosyltransferase RgtA/B/C/D-like domain-containing protein n=1 Tax=Chryseobacterium endalhagicum TaxID=2797638 RepID=A0ABS1QHC1_9FLAO|nr:hypothetical protein [Chryseobacterium endalhagicum]MBL1221993.1 hypothetical protein [Chryseobacterium endalhagicum]